MEEPKMKNSIIYYSVGALLYCPANNKTIASSIIAERFGRKYSLALCLEDTIDNYYVHDAEQQLLSTICQIYSTRQTKNFYIPKIFIRVRSVEQMKRLVTLLKNYFDIITGFIFPKFSINNSEQYMECLKNINDCIGKTIYGMPIYESSSIINLNVRHDILYKLKDIIDEVSPLILNVRVGGNDLCHYFGFRRHINESIHKITPIANIFSDLITVYGHDYVISGPVYEYYNGENWENHFKHEIKDDILCGFIGKTVIHPNQIESINFSYKVATEDFLDAQNIINWENKTSLVCGSTFGTRMNEYKTHVNWANKILYLANYYGTY